MRISIYISIYWDFCFFQYKKEVKMKNSVMFFPIVTCFCGEPASWFYNLGFLFGLLQNETYICQHWDNIFNVVFTLDNFWWITERFLEFKKLISENSIKCNWKNVKYSVQQSCGGKIFYARIQYCVYNQLIFWFRLCHLLVMH